MGIPPLLRTNIDYVFILREPYVQNRRRIFENFAGVFPSFDVFCQVMDQCTENFECLVIHTNSKSNKLEDQVFWYKATDHPPFHLCDDSLWHDNKPFSSSMLAQDEYSADNMRKKSKDPWVRVSQEGKEKR
jgi:hypothetical protein